ncbi:MAG: ABC transporter substrate-binding protein [Labedaea sp.]
MELSADGKPVAGLAGKWDATTMTTTFTLRPGVTCSDGTPLTAADVAANVNFVGDPADKSPIAGLTIAPGTKATADETTRAVTVTSGKPDSFLLRNVGSLPIACAKGMGDRKLLATARVVSACSPFPNSCRTTTTRSPPAQGLHVGPCGWKAETGLPEKVVVRVIPNKVAEHPEFHSGLFVKDV